MDAELIRNKHAAGLAWDAYLATGTPDQQKAWREVYDKVSLSDAQSGLLGAFEREINVVVVTGIWCGDCVRQGPMLQRIAEASNGKVKLVWCDRDVHMDLQQQVTVNAGNRVPVVVFAAEDYEVVGWYGDKPLSRYRIVAKQALGASCPLPGAPVPQDELDAELADWVDQFERVHLLLRLSGRLRQKHGD
ncbi:MAG: thioredoxin family protein [Planctomycetota bacterium]